MHERGEHAVNIHGRRRVDDHPIVRVKIVLLRVAVELMKRPRLAEDRPVPVEDRHRRVKAAVVVGLL